MNQYSNTFFNANVLYQYDKKIVEEYIHNRNKYIICDTIKDFDNILDHIFTKLCLLLNLIIVCILHPLLILLYQRHVFNYIIISNDHYNYIYAILYNWYKQIFSKHTEYNMHCIDINKTKEFFVINNSKYGTLFMNKQNYPSDEEIYTGKYILYLTI